MKPAFVRAGWRGAVFFLVCGTVILLEFYTQIFERGIGQYLKWQNSRRQQVGRIWDKEHRNNIAQKKIQSILSTFDVTSQSNESVDSFKALLAGVPATQVVSRERFLQLYFDYPDQWAAEIVPPRRLLAVDANKNWSRVLLSHSGGMLTVSFIDRANNPIGEVTVPSQILSGIESGRMSAPGRLEDADFNAKWIYPFAEFLPVLDSLDAVTRQSIFPDPRWFLRKNYRVTRVGVSAKPLKDSPQMSLLGIEYNSDFNTNVLLVPIPLDIAGSLQSQIEKNDPDRSARPADTADDSDEDEN